MMKTKEKSVLPSRRERRKGLSRKVIILLITVVISLSTLLMPCLVSSSLYTPSEITVKALTVNKNRQIEMIIGEHAQLLENDGYVNVSGELSPIRKEFGVNLKTDEFTYEALEKAIISNYDFYADYSTISFEGETYYFKTPQESDNFITEINKYDKVDYESKVIRKIIGAETSQDALDNAILSKRIIAEKREAERQAAARRRAVITDTNIVTDNEIVNFALQFNGNPYVYGGTSLTNGADCSGFTQSVYAHFGISLPRSAAAQASAGYEVPFDALEAGDLIFYSGDGGYNITHVAIYIGNSQIIHAQTPYYGIGVTSANIMIKMTARRVV